MKRNTLLLVIAFSFIHSFVYSQELSSPFIPNSENIEITTSLHRTARKLSSTTIDVRKNGDLFTVTKTGQGHIEHYDNASWVIKATLRDNNGFLETLDSTCHIKDKEGKALVVYKKLYDHEQGIIQWESYGENGELKKQSTFPIKGKTCDDTTMMFFLKAFMPNVRTEKQSFYLLTNEPKLYKTKIKFMGIEELDLTVGTKKAIKIKLTADIGILDDVLDRFVPKTYMWYSEDLPYTWFKYQGFEKDSGSHYVLNILNKREVLPKK